MLGMKINPKLLEHCSMRGANTIRGLMSPIAKFVMESGAVGQFVITDLRIFGATALFWLASPFMKSERATGKDMLKLFWGRQCSL